MSQPDSKSASRGRGVQVQKPRSNVYTALLLVALLALVVGCVLLYLEIKAYGGFGAIKGPAASAAAPVYTHLSPDTPCLTV